MSTALIQQLTLYTDRLNLNEKSTFVVFLRNRYSVNVANEQGSLFIEKKTTQVTTTESKEKKYTSEVQKETIKITYT